VCLNVSGPASLTSATCTGTPAAPGHEFTNDFRTVFNALTLLVVNLDFTEARDSEWQWHQLGIVELCAKIWQIMRNDFKDYARTFCQLCAPFSVLYYT